MMADTADAERIRSRVASIVSMLTARGLVWRVRDAIEDGVTIYAHGPRQSSYASIDVFVDSDTHAVTDIVLTATPDGVKHLNTPVEDCIDILCESLGM